MEENMDILLLQETKCVGDAVDEVLRRCWWHNQFIFNDSKGATGGLAILWNPTMVIMDQPFSTPDTISTHYRAIGSNKGGIITNAYRPQNHTEKTFFL